MPAEIEYKLIEVRERVDTLLAKQRAARLENNKIKQVKKKSESMQPESVMPLDLKTIRSNALGRTQLNRGEYE